jgi:hypothetical protein
MAHNHLCDVGDPQKDMCLAQCSCGWKARVVESEEMTSLEAHAELMALAYGHVYANAWMVVDDEPT